MTDLFEQLTELNLIISRKMQEAKPDLCGETASKVKERIMHEIEKCKERIETIETTTEYYEENSNWKNNLNDNLNNNLNDNLNSDETLKSQMLVVVEEMKSRFDKHVNLINFLCGKGINKLDTKESNRLFKFNKPNLYETYKTNGDIREIIKYLDTYFYTIDEVNKVVNCYDDLDVIPEVEHIHILVQKYPNINLTAKTLQQIKHSYPSTLYFIRDCIARVI